MTFARPAHAWRLVRSESRMSDPASVLARARAFVAGSRELPPLVLLTVANSGGFTGHVLTAACPHADKAVLTLA